MARSASSPPSVRPMNTLSTELMMRGPPEAPNIRKGTSPFNTIVGVIHDSGRLPGAMAFLADWSFEIVLGERDGIPRKPDPSAAHEIADELGIAPERFIYLGDTDVDMKTAIEAGMYPVGALWGFRSREELLGNGAAAVIETPLELLDYLDDSG